MTYKLPTIPGDDNAHVRAVNPYRCELLSAYTCWTLPEASICDGCINSDQFDRDNPILPLFHPDNTPVTLKEAKEVYEDGSIEVVWQYEPTDEDYDDWFDCNKAFYESVNRDNIKLPRVTIPTRQIARLTAENVFHQVKEEIHPLDGIYHQDDESRTGYEEYLDAVIDVRDRNAKKGQPTIERTYTAAEVELTGYLTRLIEAAKPHCVKTSTLNMRVAEAERFLSEFKTNS